MSKERYVEIVRNQCVAFDIDSPKLLPQDQQVVFWGNVRNEWKQHLSSSESTTKNVTVSILKNITRLITVLYDIFRQEIVNRKNKINVDDIIRHYDEILNIEDDLTEKSPAMVRLIRSILAVFPGLKPILKNAKISFDYIKKIVFSVGSFVRSRDYKLFKLLIDDGHIRAAAKIFKHFFAEYFEEHPIDNAMFI